MRTVRQQRVGLAGGPGDGGQQSRPKHLGASAVAAKLPGRNQHAGGAAHRLTPLHGVCSYRDTHNETLQRGSVVLERAPQIQQNSLMSPFLPIVVFDKAADF